MTFNMIASSSLVILGPYCKFTVAELQLWESWSLQRLIGTLARDRMCHDKASLFHLLVLSQAEVYPV